MTQSAEWRRLVRLAGSMNRKAIRLGAYGRVSSQDLWSVEIQQPACHYCGIQLEIGQGTFDHIIPFDRGGKNQFFNLTRCCLTCNRMKFTKTPEQLEAHRERTVTCARPGCGNTYRPRWAEWEAGRARLCSRRCAALTRWHPA